MIEITTNECPIGHVLPQDAILVQNTGDVVMPILKSDYYPTQHVTIDGFSDAWGSTYIFARFRYTPQGWERIA
jgi:hypothetical protein